MPARPPAISEAIEAKLSAIGHHIRVQRKALAISATTLAEAAGLSRVTLHRIETGAPAVTMAAYLNVISALGLDLGFGQPNDRPAETPIADRTGWMPARVRLSDYPQLKQLAWHVHGTDELTPAEALGIYQRNWRHLDPLALEPHEQQLVDALRLGLAQGTENV